MSSCRKATFVAAIVLSSTLAHAGDWYVDAVNGNDANSGSAANQPWRTITKALNSTRTLQAERIHIAAGVYDAALGEQFPLEPWEGQALLGAGVGLTRVQSSAAFALSVAHFPARPFPEFTSATQVQGLSLSATQQPLLVSSSWGPVRAEFRDLEVSGASLQGIVVFGTAAGIEPVFERIDSHGNNVGLGASAGTIVVRDSRLHHNNQSGLQLSTSTLVTCRVERTRLDANTLLGLDARANFLSPSAWGRVVAEADACEISGNGAGARLLVANQPLWLANSSLRLTQCTLAGNTGAGVADSGVGGRIELEESVLASNGDDVNVLGNDIAARNCLIEDGDFSGVNGCFAASPQFVSVATADYRFTWGSPCVDRPGLPAYAGTLDVARRPRSIDGDLDTLASRDLGAHEFAPLERRGVARLGQPLAFECWGPQGAATVVHFSRRPLLTTPLSTPFGALWLDPVALGTFQSTLAGASSPGLVQRNVPNSPALVGQSFSFQSRCASPNAPNGFAWSNPVSVTIAP
ncbi:MAG: DUF1565 domain-containing protein [Planctomycetota bacterium]|nr:DUF1565 domain-containing protein [Planctomycetota bacterium]